MEGPLPVAVVIHGGYWMDQYGRWVTRPLARALARRGWAAWNIGYRRLGAEGGGWPATFEDVAAAIDHLAELDDDRLDLGHVVMVGHSAGGHLALWAAGRETLPEGVLASPPRVPVAQAVGLSAVCDLRTAGRSAIALVGGNPDDLPERWSWTNPIERLPLPVPVVLGHNRDDRTVSIAEVRRFAEASRALGGATTLIEGDEGGHRGVLNPSSPVWREAFDQMQSLRSAHPAPPPHPG